MTVKGGSHQLTGMVSLGHFHGAMKNIKSGKNIIIKNTRSLRPLMLYYLYIKLRSYSFHLGRSPVDLATHLLLSDETMPALYIVSAVLERCNADEKSWFYVCVIYLAFWLHFSFQKISLHSSQSFSSI